jgi:hypothetical protein
VDPPVEGLHAEAQPLGKIKPFIKITITFEPVMLFGCPSKMLISSKIGQGRCFSYPPLPHYF